MSFYLTLWKWCFVAISHILFVLLLTAFRSFQYPSVMNHTTPLRMFDPLPWDITWNETKRTTQHEVGTEWAHGCGIPWLHHILHNTAAERALKQPLNKKLKTWEAILYEDGIPFWTHYTDWVTRHLYDTLSPVRSTRISGNQVVMTRDLCVPTVTLGSLDLDALVPKGNILWWTTQWTKSGAPWALRAPHIWVPAASKAINFMQELLTRHQKEAELLFA